MNTVTIVAYLIALLIPGFTVYLFIAQDIFGTGRPSTIIMCLGWGAVGAFGLAYVINTIMINNGIVSYDTVVGFTAPVLEELLKAAILVYLVNNPRFRYLVDGAVYGFAVGIGFAMSENFVIYLPDSGSAVLGTAISRVLSTSLMHATASGLVGIALGRTRRLTNLRMGGLLLALGFGLAMALHMFFNNIARVAELNGFTLLVAAIGIGLGGSVIIGWQIQQGLAEEKRRFDETLGLGVDVSTGERKAMQRLGGTGIEQTFTELEQIFGAERTKLVRRLLIVQANMGILRNNLNSEVSDRLREAWEEEIAELDAEFKRIRKELGPTVNLFMQSVFPSSDHTMQDTLNEELSESDPTLVHTFDMFMRTSGLSEVFSPEQLAEMAERLHRIAIFQHISLANLENLSRSIDVLSFEAGHVLFEEGDAGDAMYLIEEGAVAIYTQEQPDKPLRTFSPGEVVGEFALLDGRPRSARAQADGAVRLLRLQRQVFMMFIQSRPKVVLAMLRYLADKARYTTHAVETSMDWVTQLAQGTYQAPAVVEPAAEAEAVELEPEEISAQTISQVERAFSQAAASLHAREQSMRGRPAGI